MALVTSMRLALLSIALSAAVERELMEAPAKDCQPQTCPNMESCTVVSYGKFGCGYSCMKDSTQYLCSDKCVCNKESKKTALLALGSGDVPIDQLNTLLKAELPTINHALNKSIPMSYGDCAATDRVAPLPCSGTEYLYYVHKSWEYKAFARWVSGLKTIDITSGIAYRIAPGIGLSVSGFFADLPVSIYVGECATLDLCSKLWDNEYGCCGQNKHFNVNFEIICGHNTTDDPAIPGHYPIKDLAVANVTVDKLEIVERAGILGHAHLKDITDTIETKLKSTLTDYLSVKKIVNGTHTLVEYLNQQTMIATVAKSLCAGTPPDDSLMVV